MASASTTAGTSCGDEDDDVDAVQGDATRDASSDDNASDDDDDDDDDDDGGGGGGKPITLITEDMLASEATLRSIWSDLSRNYYATPSWSPLFYIDLAYNGFVSVA